MANQINIKRGTVATIPTATTGEPLFTTDTKKLYVGNGIDNTIINPTAIGSLTGDITATPASDGAATTATIASGSIDNNKVSASAAIELNKLASLPSQKLIVSDPSGVITTLAGVSSIEAGYLSGVTSSVQTQLDARIAKSLTSNTGDMIYASGANTPARLPIGSSGQVLKTVGGIPTWATFSGGINYLSSNPDAEADTSGWSTYADSPGASPVDGTGGTPNSTWTRTTSSPLRGSGSFLYTHNSGASRQGEGVSYDFTIDTSDKAKALQISFDYMVASGTFVAGSSGVSSDLTVWIYDKTNSVLIQPSAFKLLSNSLTIADKFTATFQTASNSTSYRLIIHNSTAATDQFGVMFDNFNVGPSTYVYGSPEKDWTAYTPTMTGLGTVTITDAFYKQSGDSIYIKGRFTLGTTTGATAGIGLPPGLSVDTTKTTITSVVNGHLTNNATATIFLPLVNGGDTSVGFSNAASTGLIKLVGTSIGSSANSIGFSVGPIPIQGWASSVQVSDQTDTRIVLAKYRFTSAKTSSPASPFNFNTLVSDTHNAVTTGASWNFTAPVPGKYFVTVVHASAGTTVTSYIYKNGIQSDQLFTSAFIANNGTMNGTAQIDLNAGDYIDVRLDTSVSVNTGHIIISRVSGPAAIAATESVNVAYGSTAGSTIGASYTLQTFTASEIDTHGAWNGTDTFTAPIAGQYSISAGILTAAVSLTTAQSVTMAVYKNGVLYRNLSRANGTGASNSYLLTGNDLIRLKAGETLQIYAVGSVATSQSTSGGYNKVTITKVGNY